MQFSAIIYKEEEIYVAGCPEVGTFSQGLLIDEAVENLKEATELYLEEFPIEKKSNSYLTTFELENA